MRFTEEVSSKIGAYVYRLIDPRNGETFYVGKGKGNRVFNHAEGALRKEDTADDDEEDDVSAKFSRIREIRNAGLEVVHVIHRHEIPDNAIFHVEAALIDAYPGLSNEQGGHGSNSSGPMHVNQIIDKYSLPQIDWLPDERLLIINVNNIQDRSSVSEIYNQVKGNWKLSKQRAERADYVIAAFRGVAIGIFKANKWEKSAGYESRFCFEGKRASPEVWEKFVGPRGKRLINDGMKHVQNPVRYWNV